MGNTVQSSIHNTGMQVPEGCYRDPDITIRRDVRPLFNVDLPILRPESEAPENKWHEIPLKTGQIIFAADRRIRCSDIEEPLRRLSLRHNPFRFVTILTGTHGDKYGQNWMRSTNKILRSTALKDTRRATDLIDPDFLAEDVEKYMDNRTEYTERPVIVQSMMNMHINVFEDILEDQRNHVILGYCYGRNDECLRDILRLPPVVSYVRDEDL